MCISIYIDTSKMNIPRILKKKSRKFCGRFPVTYFPAEISSTLLGVFYHDKAKKDTDIVWILVQSWRSFYHLLILCTGSPLLYGSFSLQTGSCPP